MAGVITKLAVQVRNRERVDVFVDEVYVCAVSLARAATLRKGQPLNDGELADLRADGELDWAYERSLRYLGGRPRSSAEVRDYLRDKGYESPVVEAVLARLVARGYVDDEAFARFWVENRNRFRPRGARALRYELRQKGVDSEVIAETLEEQDEDAVAWHLVAGKLARWRDLERAEFDQKVMGLLARRGFGYATCRRVCERAWQSLADDGETAGEDEECGDGDGSDR